MSEMQIAYRCNSCEATEQQTFSSDTASMTCSHCQATYAVAADAVDGQHVEKCLACPSDELFVRKDFPQRLGVTIVVIGLGISCITWAKHMIIPTFAILFATAFVDLALYLLMGDVLECYRCHAQYRGIANLLDHGAFDLEVHEKYRQQAARLKDAQANASASSTSPD